MSIDVTEQTLPSGGKYFLVEIGGELDRESTESARSKIGGSPYPLLVVMRDDFRVSLSNRQVVFDHSENKQLMAMVVKSPLVRAMLSFLQKAVLARMGKATPMNLFSSISEAIDWLDAEVKKSAA